MINYVTVLCSTVEIKVVNKLNCTLVIGEDAHGLALLVMQVCKESTMPNDIFCSRCCCHILEFGSRGRDTILLSTTLENKCPVE